MLLRGAILFLAVLLCAIAIEAQSAPTDDNQAPATASVADSATYSTGRSGSRLKWLVQRADAPAEDSVVRPTQYTVASSSPRGARVAQNQRPNNGGLDANERKRTPAPAPAVPLTEEMLPAEPKTDAAAPDAAPGNLRNPRPSPMPNAAPAPRTKPAEKYQIPRAHVGPNTDSMLEQYYSKDHAMEDTCPSPKDLKHIADVSTDIEPKGGELLPKECPLGNDTFRHRNFSPITYAWTASGLCHKPLYFEDVQLERYGHMAGPWVQPFASAAHFFFTVPILPYKMGLETPNECMYTLGYYRPGNCAPYLFDPIPISARGAIFEAGAWVGGVFAFP